MRKRQKTNLIEVIHLTLGRDGEVITSIKATVGNLEKSE